MAANREIFITVTLEVREKCAYDDKKLLGVSVANDLVPPKADPVAYLRERTLAELDRVTLRGAAAVVAPPTLVCIPGVGTSQGGPAPGEPSEA